MTASAPRRTPPRLEHCCEPVLEGVLEPAAAEQLAAGFKVLADPARLRLLSLLAAQPGQEACVCELTAPLGLSQPTVSHHLRILLAAGLVSRSRRATFSYYRLDPSRLAVLRDALAAPVGTR